VTLVDGGVNVAVYSSVAQSVEFCCFDGTGKETQYPLSLVDNDIWHTFVPGIAAGQEYGFRVSGPYSPASGIRCNPAKLLLDPYARAVTGNLVWKPSWRGAVITGGSDTPDGTDSAPDAPRSVLVDTNFDWGTDSQLRHVPTDSVVYELHVKGFTYLHPAVPDADKGTYAGLAHPEVVAYLRSLGVTAVELLPVHQSLTDGDLAAKGLSNYWGYETLAFFALNSAYSAARRGGGAPGSEIEEFKAMVKALHAAGIEVILDVVFNHTAEGNEQGPTLGFRGIDNATYYDLVPGQLQSYDNLSGCGNTVNTGSPAVRRLIMDCLRYWVQEMHVDGFRFDLGTVLGRDRPGTTADADPGWDESAAFFDLVLQDPTLVGIKLIAEPWDEAGNEQGQFPSRWGEWNGQYRDVVRDYWRAQVSSPRWVAARLAGSPDMYALGAPRFGLRRQPGASINFITCHDGFTLVDLVSYDAKRNTANDAGNTDGTNDNRSWNCGGSPADDGPSSNEAINSLRRRQQRNFLATMLISRGVPMLLAGDERNRTQQGNNNAYCQDNAISWVDWSESPTADNLTALVRTLTALRAQTPTLRARRFTTTPARPDEPVGETGIEWFNPDGSPASEASWSNTQGHAFAALFPDTAPAPSVLAMLNAYYEPLPFIPPPLRTWVLVLDTNQEDGHPATTEPLPQRAAITVAARSLIIATG
jgi:glycogen operon protein